MSDSEDYAGPALLRTGEVDSPVEVSLSGHVEPLDGRYHWAGRIAPYPGLAELVRGGRGTAVATLRIGAGAAVPARLTEVDPWGGVRVTGTGAPPWPDQEPPEPVNGRPAAPATDTDVAIVGAGFGGLATAIRLAQRGYRDFLVFEQAGDVGGTWRDNTYPGCACDVPSNLYSFSFALNPGWSNSYSGQPEIWAYLRACTQRFGLGPHLRLGHAVAEATWDEPARRWRLVTSGGVYTARVLVAATGPLSDPSTPDIPGLATFAGTTFHSARWRHDHDLTGRRVAVIGTGASAIQFIPQIQPVAAEVTVFQRTAAWVMPRLSRPLSRLEHAAYRSIPGAQRLARLGIYWARDASAVGFLNPPVNRLAQRLAELHLRRQVPDPVLRAQLTPNYTLGCKRVLLSNDYLPAMTRTNVTLVTDAIREVRPGGIVTADGAEHPVDTIIFGTGFHVTDPPMTRHIHGRGGRTLAEAFTPTMRAYRGTSVAGFPNFFLLLGPNTGLGHTSVVLMIESQVRYLLAALDHLRRHDEVALEPTPAAQLRDTTRIDAKMRGTVWTTGGCHSWYLDATGRNSTLWPGFATGYRLHLTRFPAADHVFVPAARPTPVPAATPAGGQS
ncbi:MAG TPA: FAD-dependent oxidoreductase [Rugosimonospora sp.]|nr:FAD-dependent oxidoreductase [Rugosimonospora sp.]